MLKHKYHRVLCDACYLTEAFKGSSPMTLQMAMATRPHHIRLRAKPRIDEMAGTPLYVLKQPKSCKAYRCAERLHLLPVQLLGHNSTGCCTHIARCTQAQPTTVHDGADVARWVSLAT